MGWSFKFKATFTWNQNHNADTSVKTTSDNSTTCSSSPQCHTYPRESVATFFEERIVERVKGKERGNFYTPANFHCCCLLHFETIFKQKLTEEKAEDRFSKLDFQPNGFPIVLHIHDETQSIIGKMRVNDHSWSDFLFFWEVERWRQR